MNDMTQLLGAKELHSFIVYSFRNYDNSNDTEVDICPADLIQDLLVHYLLTSKL
jgi:hypothetical protein